MASKLTKGQRLFLEAVAGNKGGIFHVRVTAPLWKAGFVYPRADAVMPRIVGCNSQPAREYVMTDAGLSALRAA